MADTDIRNVACASYRTTNIWRLAALLFLLALLCHLLGFAAPYWIKLDGTASSNISNIGLWAKCTTSCVSLTANPDWLLAVRVMMVATTMIGVLAVVLHFLFIKYVSRRTIIEILTIVFSFIFASLVQATLTVFTFNSSYWLFGDDTSSVTWSWAVAVTLTSEVLSVVSALLHILNKLRNYGSKAAH